MNIAIDGNEANLEKGVGINVYALNILKGLYKLNKSHKHNFTILLNSKPSSNLPKQNKFWKYKILPANRMWIITRLTPHLWRNLGKYDLFFTPSHYVPAFVPVRKVCSVMDLGYLEDSEQFTRYDYWQLKLWTAYSISISKAIITISAQSKRDIVRHYQKANKKTIVTHLGYDNSVFNKRRKTSKINRVKTKLNIVSNYLLFLGTLKPSKNIDGLIKAWAKIERKYPKISLVIAGKKGWLYENLFTLVEKLEIKRRVIFTGFIDEEDKGYLIKGALGFVLPSFWEGFGLDVLSSMASGVPVIISDRGSLPEVGGDAAIYIDPNNPSDIAQKIDKLLKCPKKDYNKLVKAGLAQANKFSWDETAKETLKVLESVAKN